MDNDIISRTNNTPLCITEIQQAEYKILCAVVDLLENNRLNYILCGGTMLGAVRHNGFIPWDDDVDLLVPRKDYEQLKLIARDSNREVDSFRICLPGDKYYPYPFIKVVDDSYTVIDERVIDECPISLWIDIFPLDHFPDEEEKHRKHVKRVRFLRTLLEAGILKKNVYWEPLLIKNTGRRLKYSIKLFLYRLMGEYQGLALLIDFIARKMNEGYADSHHFGDGVWPEGLKDYFESESVFPVVKHRFVERCFNITKNYDSYLKQFYGDYMQFPPEDKRRGHSNLIIKNTID